MSSLHEVGVIAAAADAAAANLADERAVVSALLLDPLAAREAIENLSPAEFLNEGLRETFRVAVELQEDGVQPDLMAVTTKLRDRKILDRVGGAAWLSELTGELPDVANVGFYVARIKAASRRRRFEIVAHRIAAGRGSDADLTTVRDLVEEMRGGSSSASPAVWRTLREYQEHPELLQAPETVVPGLAWRGRVSLLAAREKCGKSTLAAFGAAALSHDPDGRVLWLNLEESPFDVVKRFESMGADPDRVTVAEYLPNKLSDLRAVIEETSPSLVVLDTLTAWMSDRVDDLNSAAKVTPVMLELVDLARRYNVAVLLLHHGKKADGSYRDSTAIGASVDVLIEMMPDDKDESVRHLKPKGRFSVEHSSLRWTGTAYEPVAGELSIHDRVFQYIQHHPGCSKRAIRDNVSGKNLTKDKALERLMADRRIEDRGDAGGAKYFTSNDAIAADGPCPDPPEMPINGARQGHGRGTPRGTPEKPNGALGGHGRGTPRGTPTVPHPLTGVGGGTGAVGPAEGTDDQLPIDVERWPATPRYRLAELERRGMKRADAIAKVRAEYADQGGTR